MLKITEFYVEQGKNIHTHKYIRAIHAVSLETNFNFTKTFRRFLFTVFPMFS